MMMGLPLAPFLPETLKLSAPYRPSNVPCTPRTFRTSPAAESALIPDCRLLNAPMPPAAAAQVTAEPLPLVLQPPSTKRIAASAEVAVAIAVVATATMAHARFPLLADQFKFKLPSAAASPVTFRPKPW